MNYAGSWGALVGGFLFFQLGLCAYLTPFPLLFSIFAITVKKDKAWPTLGRYFVSSGFFMLGFGQIFAQFKPMISFRGLPFYTAGALGEQFYRFTKEFLGVWGQSIITLGCVLLGIILITQQSTTQTTKSPN
jgi:Na+/phosphate symporter